MSKRELDEGIEVPPLEGFNLPDLPEGLRWRLAINCIGNLELQLQEATYRRAAFGRLVLEWREVEGCPLWVWARQRGYSHLEAAYRNAPRLLGDYEVKMDGVRYYTSLLAEEKNERV